MSKPSRPLRTGIVVAMLLFSPGIFGYGALHTFSAHVKLTIEKSYNNITPPNSLELKKQFAGPSEFATIWQHMSTSSVAAPALVAELVSTHQSQDFVMNRAGESALDAQNKSKHFSLSVFVHGESPSIVSIEARSS